MILLTNLPVNHGLASRYLYNARCKGLAYFAFRTERARMEQVTG
jgi:hypothetical protein